MEVADRLLKSGRAEAALEAYRAIHQDPSPRSIAALLERQSACLLQVGLCRGIFLSRDLCSWDARRKHCRWRSRPWQWILAR